MARVKELSVFFPAYNEEVEIKLAKEMIGYRGVVHESAMSELKHSKVMVLRAMVEGLRAEIEKLKAEG